MKEFKVLFSRYNISVLGVSLLLARKTFQVPIFLDMNAFIFSN